MALSVCLPCWFYHQHDLIIWCKCHIPFCQSARIRDQNTAEGRSLHDLRPDCRLLHTCLPSGAGPERGYPLLIAVWSLALIGIGIKFLWITCPKWFSSVIYIAMGWICVFVFSPIVHRLPAAAFGWLLAGGIIYTVGGIIYALKLPLFNARHQYFGSHEIFHLFVMGGSFCHFIFMYQYVIGLS